jgi:hypothetical protein
LVVTAGKKESARVIKKGRASANNNAANGKRKKLFRRKRSTASAMKLTGLAIVRAPRFMS